MSKKDVLKTIMRNESFLLTGHMNPDGDSLACQLALAEALEQLGKHVSLQSADAVPAMYRQLPGADRIRRVKEIEGSYDVAILMECPDIERTGFDRVPARTLIGIDHHPEHPQGFHVNWVNEKAAAAAELVYSLLQDLGCEITASMAENLFAAILTDTGSFNFSNTTARALEIAAQLIRKGAVPEVVAQKVYNSYPPEKLDLIGLLLSNMRRQLGGKFILLAMDYEQITKHGYASEIFENIVNFPLMTQTVRVSALGRESEPGFWRFSMRSKGAIDIGSLARELGGGGHRNAAGFRWQGTLEEIESKLVGVVGALLQSAPEESADL